MHSIPAHDPKLLDLKRIAEAGSDRGPFYDKGIRSVIEEIVNKKQFEPNLIAALLLTAKHEGEAGSANDLPAAAQDFLTESDWTLAQGIAYAEGVHDTEQELHEYCVEPTVR